jgi:hypothetical protein
MPRAFGVVLALLATGLLAPAASPVSVPPPYALIETPHSTFIVAPAGWQPTGPGGTPPSPQFSCGAPCIPPSGLASYPSFGVVRPREVVRISLFMPVTSVRAKGFGAGRLTVLDASSGRLSLEVRRKKSFVVSLSIRHPRGESLRYDILLTVVRRR